MGIYYSHLLLIFFIIFSHGIGKAVVSLLCCPSLQQKKKSVEAQYQRRLELGSCNFLLKLMRRKEKSPPCKIPSLSLIFNNTLWHLCSNLSHSTTTYISSKKLKIIVSKLKTLITIYFSEILKIKAHIFEIYPIYPFIV